MYINPPFFWKDAGKVKDSKLNGSIGFTELPMYPKFAANGFIFRLNETENRFKVLVTT
jgi:hypothetical protein